MIPGWPGLTEAMNIAVAICRAGYGEMYVSHSPGCEYCECYYVEAHKVEKDDGTADAH